MDNDRRQRKTWLGIGLVGAALAVGMATFFAWPLFNEPGGPRPGEPPTDLRFDAEDADARARGSARLDQLVENPRAYSRCPLVVSGRVFPADDGFFLVDRAASIWVDAPVERAVGAVRPGDRRSVRVEVRRLTDESASSVATSVRTAGDALPAAVTETPVTVGQPFLVLAEGEAGVDEREPARAGVYELGDLQSRFERACLNVTRTGLGSVLDEEIDQPTLSALRYEIVPGGREFELLVFPSAQAARAALDDVRDTEMVEDGGEVAVGQNVVAAFPDRIRDFRGYRVVRDVLRGLD